MTSTGPVTKQDLRKFGLLFGSLVIALFGLLIPALVGSLLQKLWPWYLGGSVILLALVWPPILKPLYHAWMKFGEVAGWINTRIILLILFYVVVFPVGLVMKLFGADPLHRKAEPEAQSYRVLREAVDKKHMEKPY